MKNNKDIELTLFRLKEGLLNESEAREAAQFLQQHPEWQKVADLYDPQLKAPSYPDICFSNKDRLRKPLTAPAAPHQSRTLWFRRLSIAASIILAISIAAWFLLAPQSKESSSVIVAENTMDKIPGIEEINENENQNENKYENENRGQGCPRTRTKTKYSTKTKTETKTISIVDTATTKTADEPSWQAQTATVTMTDRLIVYLDDTEPANTNDIPIELTDRMITYHLPTDTTTAAPSENSSSPAWKYSIEDWWNGLQLAYTERQNEIINRFSNKNQ